MYEDDEDYLEDDDESEGEEISVADVIVSYLLKILVCKALSSVWVGFVGQRWELGLGF